MTSNNNKTYVILQLVHTYINMYDHSIDSM